MNSSDRLAVVGFAAAVLAAGGLVAWLSFGKRPEILPPPVPSKSSKATGTTRDPSAPPDDGSANKATPPVRKAPAHEVRGVVRLADGSPAEGAEVQVFRASVARGEEERRPAPAAGARTLPLTVMKDLLQLDPDEFDRAGPYTGVPVLPAEPPPPARVGEARAGADGAFLVRVPSPGLYRVHASKEGHGQAVASGVIAGGEPATLVLGALAALRGTVLVDPTRAPAAGASVVVRSGKLARSATAGPDGAFEVPELPPGNYDITAGLEGHAPADLRGIAVGPGQPPLEVVLGEGFTILVTVQKHEAPPPGWRRGTPLPPGPPLEGAVVYAVRRDTLGWVSATTGPDGIARLARLGAGHWRLAARKEGYNAGFPRDVKFVPGGVREEAREARLLPEVRKPVRVLAAGGTPLAGARLYTGGVDDEFDEAHSDLLGRTDENGSLEVVFDETILRRSVVWVVPDDGSAAFMLEPDDAQDPAPQEVTLRPGRVVTGRVIEQEGGKPVPSAVVTLQVVDDDHDVDWVLVTRAGKDGTYRFAAVPAGELTIEAETDDFYGEIEVEASESGNPLSRDIAVE